MNERVDHPAGGPVALMAGRDDQTDILDQVFDEDYLDFHDPITTASRTETEAAVILRLIERRPPAGLLDLCCGHGRLSLRLSQAGFRMTGLDQSQPALRRAKAEAAAAGQIIAYDQGDAAALPYADGSFDGILCWFTSFGLGDDPTNRRILAEARRVLRPGGCLLLDLANPFYLVAGFQRNAVYERDSRLMVDCHDFDPISMRLWIDRRFFGGDRPQRRIRFFLRQFTLPELSGWLADAGFAWVSAHDGDGNPFTLSSGVMIVRAGVAP